MQVKYIAYNRQGEKISGVIEAESKQVAEDMLWQSDLIVTQIKPVFRIPGFYELFPSLSSPGRHVITWAKQLATLLNSGVPLLTALNVLRGEQSHRSMRQPIEDVIKYLEAGGSFADALADQPKVFPPILVRLVSIGQQTGELDSMLLRAAEHLESQASVKSKLKSSLAYPAVVAGSSLISVWILITFTIPMLSGLLEEFNADMPLTTRLIIGIGTAVRNWGLWFLLLLVAAGVGAFLYRKRPEGKEKIDRFMLRLPLLGPLMKTNLQSRTTQTITSLISAGIPLLEAVRLTRDNTDNMVMRKALDQVENDLLEGSTFSQALRRSGLFSPILIEMATVGEQSGNLAEQLGVVSGILASEFDRTVSKLVSSIEPMMIIIVGLVVGVIAVTVITTVYSVLPAVGG